VRANPQVECFALTSCGLLHVVKIKIQNNAVYYSNGMNYKFQVFTRNRGGTEISPNLNTAANIEEHI
ncbi:MAG: hypothetical protein ACR2IH_05950, partial [Pyrinomonadaceae bacterium]